VVICFPSVVLQHHQTKPSFFHNRIPAVGCGRITELLYAELQFFTDDCGVASRIKSMLAALSPDGKKLDVCDPNRNLPNSI
jgi:hypothetical protein